MILDNYFQMCSERSQGEHARNRLSRQEWWTDARRKQTSQKIGLAFLPAGIFTNDIFTIWHFYQCHFYHLTFLPLAFLPSGIFTNDIFTIWHIYQWHFYHLAFLPMAFVPYGIFTNGIFTYGNLTYGIFTAHPYGPTNHTSQMTIEQAPCIEPMLVLR